VQRGEVEEPTVNRREAFTAAAASVLAAVLPVAATAAPEPGNLREVRRWCGDLQQWVRCRMYDLREGDSFRLDGTPRVYRACCDGFLDESGAWAVIYQDDPRPDHIATVAGE
jgi:hypothetical protein